jgi:hypothetical protein
MNRKTAALIGTVAGVGLGVYYGKIIGRGIKRVPIVLRKAGESECGVDPVPDVELKLFPPEPMVWDITNPSEGGCGATVNVRITGWRRGDEPSAPAVLALKFDRDVKPGHTATIPALANTVLGKGSFKYDIYVGPTLALDPIVKLVL